MSDLYITSREQIEVPGLEGVEVIVTGVTHEALVLSKSRWMPGAVKMAGVMQAAIGPDSTDSESSPDPEPKDGADQIDEIEVEAEKAEATKATSPLDANIERFHKGTIMDHALVSLNGENRKPWDKVLKPFLLEAIYKAIMERTLVTDDVGKG